MAHDEDPRDGNIQWRPVYQTSRALTKAERAYAVPPLWSGFPDFGPDPDFFGQIGPDSVRILLKSPDFS